MTNTKCQKCGLVNFASALVCKRCGASLADELETDESEPARRVSPLLRFLTTRPGAALFLLLFIALGIYNWHGLIYRRYYYPRTAFLTPLGILTFMVLTISPGFVNRPRDRKYSIQIWLLLGVGLMLGALNYYLMGWVY
jgi:hypothetical protein